MFDSFDIVAVTTLVALAVAAVSSLRADATGPAGPVSRRGRAWLALVVVVSLSLGAGALKLRSDVGYRAFLGDTHPAVAGLDRFLDHYGDGVPMAAVWSCDESPCDSATDDRSLAMSYAVVRAMAAADRSLRILSPATASIFARGPFGFERRRLVEFGEPVENREDLVRAALAQPWWRGRLLSEDGSTGAIVVELADSSSEAFRSAVSALRDSLAPFEAEGFRFHLVGNPVEFVVAGDDLARDSVRLVPVMVALVVLLVWLLYRSLAIAALALLPSSVAIVWTFGLMGWLGWAQNSVSQAVAPMLLVIGVCDAIHLLARYAAVLGEDDADAQDPSRAVLRAAALVWRPCVWTTLTTAGALLGFLSSELESFRAFGVAAAFGVTVALYMTFVVLPVLVAWWRPAVDSFQGSALKTGDAPWRRIGTLLAIPARRPGLIVAVACLAVLLGSAGATRLRVDASPADLYGEGSDVVRWLDFVSENLRRPETMEVDLVAPPGRPAVAEETLNVLRSVSAELERVPGLGPTLSIATVLDWIDDIGARGNRSREEVLAEIGSLDPGLLSRLLGRDRDRLRITLDADKLSQTELGQAVASAQAALPRAEGWQGTLGGPLVVLYEMIGAVQRTQWATFATAFAVVALLLRVLFSSWLWMLVGLLPTVLPVVVVLGWMGAFGIPLEPGRTMVAAVVLGLAVDDTIHFLSAYRAARRREASVEQALDEALAKTAGAIVTTSLALTAGFASLTLSSWRAVSSFGGLSALAILGALASALIVLPALVRVVAGFRTSLESSERAD